jgi:hypothetical protein
LLTETEAKKVLTLSDLDTFHALYELKHADQMPRRAKRKIRNGREKKPTRDQAPAKFPISTPLAREDDGDILVEGKISGY